MKTDSFDRLGTMIEVNTFRVEYEKGSFSLQFGYMAPNGKEITIVNTLTMNDQEMEALIIGLASASVEYQKEHGGFDHLNISMKGKEGT